MMAGGLTFPEPHADQAPEPDPHAREPRLDPEAHWDEREQHADGDGLACSFRIAIKCLSLRPVRRLSSATGIFLRMETITACHGLAFGST